MPVFHTKTIESILEPVAQQVSRLVILHEEAEDGNAMPDLERPVQAVSRAVTNLVKVGRETINSSDDALLKQDMPSALYRVEGASRLLEEASAMLKQDPYSGPARKKLIEGSRGILQGTSSLLLYFDESEVRKIIRECKRVLDYLAVAEVIETMEDLVHFLKNLSPCLSKVSREVSAREKELTHQVHREILVRCLDEVKTLAPILICSMKIFIHIIGQGGKGAEEAAENRNYLSGRMSDELNEIIRVLQLTTYDEEEWDADQLTVLKKAQSAIESRMRAAQDWLEDGSALRGGVGEKSLRQIIEQAERLAERCLAPSQAEPITKLTSQITTMTDALCELRQDGKGNSPQAESLARAIKDKLNDLRSTVYSTIVAVDKSGIAQTAHTVAGRLEQANKWLLNPQNDDKGLGQRAIALIVHEGKKVAEGLPGIHKAEILNLCDEVDNLSRQLGDLCAHGQGNTPRAQDTARQLSQKLYELKNRIQQAVVSRVVEDFIDISTPLKQFTDAVLSLEGTPGREQNFNDKAHALQTFSNRAAKTARMVAAGGSGGNKKLAEALAVSASQVESLTPQLVNAGRIRMTYPESKAADEHFENLRQQYAETIQRARALCDEATDSGDFIRTSEEQIQKHSFLCDDAISKNHPQKMVDNTAAIARLANRVILVAKQESDNSEDPAFIQRVNLAADGLQNSVAPMVQDAKAVAINTNDGPAVSRWRESNRALLSNVGQVRKAITVNPDLPPPPDMSQLRINNEEQMPGQQYSYFTDKVGQPLRNQPSPSSLRVTSPTLTANKPQGRSVSPLPKWARGGDNPDLLYQELASEDELEQSMRARDMAPPRPPLPGGELPPPRPPPPETDDEDEMFMHAPQPNQPIMMAAHGLHQEVRQWSSKDNDIIAAAKKMAVLMGRLSGLVRGEGGNKRDLIACAKAIAEASQEVTRLAKELARECTDKRIRTNLLQVCERIPTIGTQLKILSTVKATMLGAQEMLPSWKELILHGTEEDQEATDMLVGNAQNLMQSVKETVRAAECASIKIRTASGMKLRWVRRQPWYQY
ncbi:vinculin isoform X2 [Neodiprion pinetum]|uniref:Vinculin n=1 Tax=Neodiprion lecontei TaxID=441921 RepID=A0ABM3FMG4_NEOLC|nr:vinculin isoform X2 [Neodiprion fabricii]XP_046470936.1 vinculin isoform X2 [Neodiprion pinetum]XP_046589212.1 vinculin isoform X2 [Neodiprion lecontei]